MKFGSKALAAVASASTLAAALLVAPTTAAAADPAPADLGVVSWGANDFGELGDGTTHATSVPVPAVGIPDGVRQISAGSAHALALTIRGEVWAWGANFDGEVGDGTKSQRPSPQRVPGITNAIAVGAGNGFSLAVLANGTVKAWGQNLSGQLGIPAGPDQLSPVTVPGLTGVSAVAAGGGHSLARGGDGTVWEWGSAGLGQLGNGTIPDSQPVPVQAAITQVTYIAGGDSHTLAVRSDGTVWAWGLNLERQVADDVEFRQPNPRLVVGLPAGITQVAAGRSDSVALDGGGHTWTWGRVFGNPTENHPVPFQTPGLAGATTISAGNGHYHALVHRPAFSIALSPAAGTLLPGGSLNTQVRLTPTNGYTGHASLAVTGLPNGVSAFLAAPTIGPGSPDPLTLRATTSAQPGTYPITVTATDPTLVNPVQTAIYQLTVSAAATFTIALTEQFGDVNPGGTATTKVELTPINDFTGSAKMSVSPPQSGITVTLDRPGVNAANPVTVTVTTSPDAPQGTYAVTLTASGAGTSSSALYLITIGGGPVS